MTARKQKTVYGGSGSITRRESGSKNMNCRECQEKVENVDYRATSVLCYKCLSKSLNSRRV
jgi:Zn finger protein HypA/HybF involved in hydrogenase expression